MYSRIFRYYNLSLPFNFDNLFRHWILSFFCQLYRPNNLKNYSIIFIDVNLCDLLVCSG
jgi:hypothetical protein